MKKKDKNYYYRPEIKILGDFKRSTKENGGLDEDIPHGSDLT